MLPFADSVYSMVSTVILRSWMKSDLGPNPLTYCALFSEPVRRWDINKCMWYIKVFTFWRKRIIGKSFKSSSDDNLLLHIIFLATKAFMSNICLYEKKAQIRNKLSSIFISIFFNFTIGILLGFLKQHRELIIGIFRNLTVGVLHQVINLQIFL